MNVLVQVIREAQRDCRCGGGSDLVEWSSKVGGKRELMVARVPRRETRPHSTNRSDNSRDLIMGCSG